MIAPETLEILACPLCESRPRLRLDGEFLVCDQCGARFRILNGIADLLPEHAILPNENAP